MIAFVVAKASNNVIGNSNDLPWYLPADLRHFKELTLGHTVIMGRKTFDSIYKRVNGPLPGRRNIVVSSSLNTIPERFELAASPEQAIDLASTNDTIFVIGGASIYNEFLSHKLVDEIYLTEVHADIPGDTYFAELDAQDWQEISRVPHQKDDKNPYDYDFVLLKRQKA